MPGLKEELVANGPVDLIHATNLGLEGLAVIAERQAAKRDVPLLLTPFIHLGSDRDRTARRLVSMPHQRRLLSVASHLVAMTHIEANFIKSLGVAPERLTVSGVGIHPEEVTGGGDGERFRAKHRIAGALAGTAGAVAFDKGSKDLVLAVSKLRREGHAVELVLAGPRLEHFDVWFSTLDESSKQGVHLLGFISPEEKRDMLAALDVLAMPSRTESFGIAYLEGWANRKPVLAARAGAMPELVRDGENGILVEFGDVDAIAKSILELLSSRSRAASMGDKGYALTTTRFTWPLVLERVLGAYSCALGFDLPEVKMYV
jgi:glycosyltransferase involved in cell wall biosynthesis